MRAFTTLLLAGLLGLLAACNTMSGVGQDLKSGGEAISDTADDAQAKM
ncbi:entericidin A/B family lipoprotein [Amaricoccus sp.]|nr:entericidin A/B family lipoprotein [Amaricoccus sp.]MBP7001845.1 entericidin A/B family lipoprotein [Amaricoccus sp.]